MEYLATGREENLSPGDAPYIRPIVTEAEMLMGTDHREVPAEGRIPLAAMGLYALIAAWPSGPAPTAAELAAYTGTPGHEMDQMLTLLRDHGYIESAE